MKTFLALLILLSLNLYSQESCTIYNIGSQKDLDNFIQQNPTCNTLDFTLDLYFSENEEYMITDLSPLRNIEIIEGDLEISGITSITDLSGLSNLKHIKGNLIINIKGLSNLKGFDSLEEIENLDITNSSLNSLEGLESLRKVSKGISIQNNDSLTDISSLNPKIEFTDEFPAIIVTKNSQLGVCNSELVCSNYDTKTLLIFQFNSEGCNSYEEVEASCLQSSVIESDLINNSFEFNSEKSIRIPNTFNKNNIRIYNILGRDLTSQLTQTNNIIDLNSLQTGLYILIYENQKMKFIVD